MFMNNPFFSLKKALKLIAVAGACMMVFASCGDKSGNTNVAYDPNQPVEVTSFTPDSGRISEMVLLDGSNFGTDPSLIKVFFNSKEAKVISSTGTRILALVPRLPGDTCVVSVEVAGQKAAYPGFFRYKIEASVTTFAGDGTNALNTTSLDKSQLKPVYIGVDREYNVFVGANHSGGVLLKLNEAENSVTVLATTQHGFDRQCMPYSHPLTDVMLMGAVGSGIRDRFLTLDPKEGWAPKMQFIKNWTVNGFTMPDEGSFADGFYETHYHCLYCEADGYYYTRYNSGHLVKINPETWDAEVIYVLNSGIAYGMAFHPIRKAELWIGYEAGHGGDVANSLCRLDVTDPAGTFQKMSGYTSGGFKDGPLAQAQFKSIRQLNFDNEGNLFVGDNGNQCIRKVDTENMMVETVVGIPGLKGDQNGKKEEATFNDPHGLVADIDGILYVSEYSGCKVRRIAIE
jgi:streptogramin lyase